MATNTPWDQILVHGPRVMEAAKSLFKTWESRPKPEPIDPNAEVKIQIATISERLQALERAEAGQAEVVKNMAEQIQGLSSGLSALSKKITAALWLAGGALLVSVAALLVAILR